jgi:hypothetical protein
MGQNADKLHHALGNFFTLMIICMPPLWLLLITKAWAMCKSWCKGQVEAWGGTRSKLNEVLIVMKMASHGGES